MNAPEYILDYWTTDRLRQVIQYFTNQTGQAFLVGGSVRNLLLHQPCTDWDIATSGAASTQARQLAAHIGGAYAHLHDKADRVSVKDGQHALTIDIAPLQGGSIEADLRLRDFTANALALPLAALLPYLTTLDTPLDPHLIDPLHGQADLAAGQLGAVDDAVFQHDPLRMLRAIRLRQRYQLAITAHTRQLLTRDAPLLTRTAPERIHDELYAILQPAAALERLHYLDEHNLLTTLIPEFIPARAMPQPSLHHWDVLEHSLQTVAMLENLLEELTRTPAELAVSKLDLNQEGLLVTLQALLREAQEQELLQLPELSSPALKLGALLHDIGKTTTYAVDATSGAITFYHHPQAGVPLLQKILPRLGISTRERRLIQQVAAHHMRPGQLSHDNVTPRAIRRYFVDLGPAGIKVALVSLADHLAMRGPEPLTQHWQRHLATVCLLLTTYIRQRDSIIPPRLLQADELIHRLKIKPGPLVGQLLEAIAEAQTEGLIHSKEEALWLAEEKIHTQ